MLVLVLCLLLVLLVEPGYGEVCAFHASMGVQMIHHNAGHGPSTVKPNFAAASSFHIQPICFRNLTLEYLPPPPIHISFSAPGGASRGVAAARYAAFACYVSLLIRTQTDPVKGRKQFVKLLVDADALWPALVDAADDATGSCGDGSLPALEAESQASVLVGARRVQALKRQLAMIGNRDQVTRAPLSSTMVRRLIPVLGTENASYMQTLSIQFDM